MNPHNLHLRFDKNVIEITALGSGNTNLENYFIKCGKMKFNLDKNTNLNQNETLFIFHGTNPKQLQKLCGDLILENKIIRFWIRREDIETRNHEIIICDPLRRELHSFINESKTNDDNYIPDIQRKSKLYYAVGSERFGDYLNNVSELTVAATKKEMCDTRLFKRQNMSGLASSFNDNNKNGPHSVASGSIMSCDENQFEITPDDLIIHTLQYLEPSDLYQFEKTSNRLCRIARNPLSLYSAVIKKANVNQLRNYYLQPRYRKIKKLVMQHYDDMEFEDGFYTQIKHPPNPFSVCPSHQFFPYLQHISLSNTRLEYVYDMIVKCSGLNIITLNLEKIYDHILPFGGVTSTIIYQKINHFQNNINSKFPLQQLQNYSIDYWSVMYFFGAQYLTYWILANGKKNKTFSMTYSDLPQLADDFVLESGPCGFFSQYHGCDDRIYEMETMAVCNIENLHLLVCSDEESIDESEDLMKNIMKLVNINNNQDESMTFNKFTLEFDYFFCGMGESKITLEKDKSLTQLMDGFVSISNQSKLIIQESDSWNDEFMKYMTNKFDIVVSMH